MADTDRCGRRGKSVLWKADESSRRQAKKDEADDSKRRQTMADGSRGQQRADENRTRWTVADKGRQARADEAAEGAGSFPVMDTSIHMHPRTLTPI